MGYALLKEKPLLGANFKPQPKTALEKAADRWFTREKSPSTMAGASDKLLHTDHLGTPQLITDQAQTTVWAADYDPFGQANITTELITNNLRFPGQYFDQETGLHYNLNRYYSPEGGGRYITSDPIGLDGGINTYLYADANPIRFTDPLGLFTYNKPPPATKPLNGDVLVLATCMERCLGFNFVVTGGSECTPDGRHVPGGRRGSKHCTNQAFDMRKHGLPRNDLLCCAKQCGAEFALDEGTHWHFQTVPGRSGGSGALSGLTCSPAMCTP